MMFSFETRVAVRVDKEGYGTKVVVALRVPG